LAGRASDDVAYPLDPVTHVLTELVLRVQLDARPRPLEIRGGISATSARVGAVYTLARRLGVSGEALRKLQFVGRPSVSLFLKIVAASGEPMSDFLRHPPRSRPREGAWRPHRGYSGRAVAAIRSAVEAEIEKPVAERASLAGLAERLDVSVPVLRYHCPIEARRLGRERAGYRASIRRERRAALLDDAREAVAQLEAEGKRPSLARIEATLGRRGVSLAPDFRSAIRLITGRTAPLPDRSHPH
jgi:hypothetical protein